jgi:glycosyltransferase involved in cell wall biosynthesis
MEHGLSAAYPRTMRVGIDAQHLSHALTGIGRYTWEMIKQLAQQPVEIVAYLPSQPVVDITTVPQVQFKISDFNSNLRRTAWAQTVLPWQANRDHLDAFWSPAHRLPFLLNRSIRSVVTIHDVTWKIAPHTMKRSTYWLERLCMPHALKKSQVIVSDSYATTQDLLRLQMADPQKIRTIHLGHTQLPHAGPRSDLHASGLQKDYFLFVGTLEPRKNLHALLSAYASLAPAVKDQAELLIVGGRGWGALNLPDLLVKHQLTEHVKVLGFVDDAQLSTLYQHALFLAMPSIYEGFGLPVVEAMSKGLCVLGARETSVEEIAQSAGLMINPHDVQDIAQALQQLITNAALRENLSSSARMTASRFTWERCSQELLHAMHQSLQK